MKNKKIKKPPFLPRRGAKPKPFFTLCPREVSEGGAATGCTCTQRNSHWLLVPTEAEISARKSDRFASAPASPRSLLQARRDAGDEQDSRERKEQQASSKVPIQDPSSSSPFNSIQFLPTILPHLSFMQAAGESRQLKRIVKNKKMGTTQRQLLLLFFLSAVAPQVRASSFFPSSALSVSNPSPSATYHCTTPARQ